jgi:NADH-quinone oxidoreductase subunit L
MIEYVYLIPLIPLVTSVVILLGSKNNSDKSLLPWLGIVSMAVCFIMSATIAYQALWGGLELPYYKTMPWFEVSVVDALTLGVLIDGPAAIMLFVVTLVSLLVHIYSIGYLHGDPRYKRYYAFLSFFTASMLGLVVSSNLLVVFLSWELVGVASYFLIGFWFEKPGPAYASKKAFITNKLGDCGLYIGLLLLYKATNTFDLNMLAYHASQDGYLAMETATIVGFCFLIGAMSKSAQIPLFIWLPDAMEGPTPVSALIHAATMVTAGIYLIIRTYFIFAAGPLALGAVAWVGLLTALAAATMALTATDIKRVLAYSTVSQLGYMMLGLGVGGYTAAMFHLTTHAFFKALLFLGAGSVIHAVHTNDMREMGGLSKKMPTTFITMLIATLAISGFPFLSGWYSKEEILHAAYVHNPGMWFIGLVTAGLTTFYMFRLVFMTFLGKSRDHAKWDHAHESPSVMTWPLWILAVLSIISGYVLHHNGLLATLVNFDLGHHGDHHAPGWIAWAAFAVFAGGLFLAHRFYGSDDFSVPESLKQRFAFVHNLLEKRYYLDDFWLWWVDLSDRIAKAMFWVDVNIVDAIFIDGWAFVCRALAEIQAFLDDFFVDGAVDGVGTITQDAGWGLHKLVGGRVQEYLLFVAAAVMTFTIFITTR